jgi:hypothetical protein
MEVPSKETVAPLPGVRLPLAATNSTRPERVPESGAVVVVLSQDQSPREASAESRKILRVVMLWFLLRILDFWGVKVG